MPTLRITKLQREQLDLDLGDEPTISHEGVLISAVVKLSTNGDIRPSFSFSVNMRSGQQRSSEFRQRPILRTWPRRLCTHRRSQLDTCTTRRRRPRAHKAAADHQ